MSPASMCAPDTESVAGGWWLVAGGGWVYKTNGFSISFGLFACKTNGFSMVSVAGSIKPLFFYIFLDRVYKTNAFLIFVWTESIKPMLF